MGDGFDKTPEIERDDPNEVISFQELDAEEEVEGNFQTALVYDSYSRNTGNTAPSAGDILSLPEQLIRSAAHAAIQAPIDSAAEIMDHQFDTDFSGNVQLIKDTEKAPFGSLTWHVQEAGHVLGAVPWILGLTKGAGAARAALGRRMFAGRAMSLQISADYARAFASVADMTAGGALYGTFVQPMGQLSQEGRDSTGQFWANKIAQGGLSGATFGFLELSSAGLRNSRLATRWLDKEWKIMAAAGVPTGIFSTELATHGNATTEQLWHGAYSFGVFGAGFGKAGEWAGTRFNQRSRGIAEAHLGEQALMAQTISIDSMTRKLIEPTTLDGRPISRFSIWGGRRVREMATEFNAEIAKLEAETTTDAVTGMANKRAFERALERERIRADRHDDELGLLYLDLNLFKAANDTHGHAAGDMVLVEMGKLLHDSNRSYDVIGRNAKPENGSFRTGGDELMGLYPRTTAEDLAMIAQRMRERVKVNVYTDAASGKSVVRPASEPLPAGAEQIVTVSVSVGHASYKKGLSLADVIKKAEDGMYADKKAQKAGRV